MKKVWADEISRNGGRVKVPEGSTKLRNLTNCFDLGDEFHNKQVIYQLTVRTEAHTQVERTLGKFQTWLADESCLALAAFLEVKETRRKMLVCRSAKHPKIWGTLSAIFSIPWRPLPVCFSALVFQSSTHQTSATSGPSALPSGADSPDVVAALPPQKRVLRGAAQAWCGSSQAQALWCACVRLLVFEASALHLAARFRHSENFLFQLTLCDFHFPCRKCRCSPGLCLAPRRPRPRY